MAIAQTLTVGTVEAQRDYAAAQAQKILDQLVAMTAQRDALAAALTATLEALSDARGHEVDGESTSALAVLCGDVAVNAIDAARAALAGVRS